jgi:hypothetical protein
MKTTIATALFICNRRKGCSFQKGRILSLPDALEWGFTGAYLRSLAHDVIIADDTKEGVICN